MSRHRPRYTPLPRILAVHAKNDGQLCWIVHPIRRSYSKRVFDMAEVAVVHLYARIVHIGPSNRLEAGTLGLYIRRPKLFEDGERKTEAAPYVLKSRYDELGYPPKLEVDYHLNEGRFKATDYRMACE